MTTLTFWWNRESRDSPRPRYRRIRSVFLRGMGLVYLAAFGSMAAQVDGLIGSRGILPAAEYLDQVRQVLKPGPARYWQLPTLFWLNASDPALHALCWGGMALSVALVVGLLPGLCTSLLWVFYLSIVVVGQVFLGYQWDSLLLEAGLLTVLVAPWGIRLGRAEDEPWPLGIWLVRWLVFRLMFLSGLLKLSSGDPTWWQWKALEYHYQTQPLPVWTSWYIHQSPPWFHGLSVGFMFFAEVVAPFFMVGPRRIRLAGFASLVLLQCLIAATGTYGFFNLISVVLCLTLLDDRDWEWLLLVARHPRERCQRLWSWAWRRPRPTNGTVAEGGESNGPGRSWPLTRRVVTGVVGGFIIAVTLGQTLESVMPNFAVPGVLVTLGQWSEPLRSFNSYGLFRVMTKQRREIVVEGSDDGVSWKPYRFPFKPCELDRRPRFTTLHLPRLDWQMWFAALGRDCRFETWFLRFEQRLLEGSPEVLGLLRENPFPGHPPRYVRARLYLYTFTRLGSADWWAREDLGLYCPPLTLGDSE